MPPVYDPGIADLLSSKTADPGDQAVACNLRHDHRISSAREAEVDNYTSPGVRPHPRTGAALKSLINDYFDRRVRFSFRPDYIVPEWNDNNFVPIATSANPDGLNGSRMLVRVLDLSRLRPVYKWAYEQALPQFLDYGSAATDKALGDWLKSRLAGGGRQFVPALLEAMDRRRHDYPYEPAWAVWWQEFRPFLNRPAERWLDLLGLENRHSDALPHWLVLLRYRLRDVRTLACPTQLDGGWYRFHFPSPLQDEPRLRRGHPMDLAAPPPNRKLLSEFIHQQIRHTDHWTGHLKSTHPNASGELKKQRDAHYHRLRNWYPALRGGGWIEECL
jgi:hypothetical protein